MIRRLSPYIAAVTLLLAAGFALRLAGVPYGFPLLVNSDEMPILVSAVQMLESGSPNPHFFNYPSLYLYLETACFGAIYGVGKLAGVYGQLVDLKGLTMPYAGRLLTVVLGTGTVLATYLAGRLLLGPAAALLAAALVAVSRLHVAHSFQMAVDVPAGLFVALALWAAARRHVHGPRWRDYVLGAVFAGLATGTKYTAFLAIVPLVWAHFAGASGREAGGTLRRLGDRRLPAALALMPVVFLLTTPYAVLDFATFRDHLLYEAAHYGTGHPGAEAASTSYGAYLTLLWNQAGAATAGLAALGAMLLLRRRPRTAGLLLVFPVCYLLFVGRYPVHFARNMIPLVPFLALLAASAVAEPLRYLGAPRPPRIRAAVMAIALLLATVAGAGLFDQASRSLAHVRTVTLPDTRWEAMQWARSHLPPGARVLAEVHGPPLDQLLLEGRPAFEVTALGGSAAAYPLKTLARFDYLVLSGATYGRFLADPERYPAEAARYEAMFARFALVRKFAPEPGRTTGPVIRFHKVR